MLGSRTRNSASPPCRAASRCRSIGLEADRRVLHVEQDPVEAAARRDLGRGEAVELQPEAELRRAVGKPPLEQVRRILGHAIPPASSAPGGSPRVY